MRGFDKHLYELLEAHPEATYHVLLVPDEDLARIAVA